MRFFTPLFLLAMIVAAAGADDAVDSPYQSIAEATKWDWTWTANAKLARCTANTPAPYHVTSAFTDGYARIGVLKQGREVYSWQGHAESVFLILGDMLYHTEHHPTCSGCEVRAVDLATGKTEWSSLLQGLGSVKHSKYRNQVHLEAHGMGALRILGFESAGSYVEYLDRRTGTTIGHRLFTAAEMRAK